MFLVRSLEIGGAERQLVTLARGLKTAGHNVSVAVFYSGGDLEGALEEDGIRVVDLKKERRWRFIGFFRRLLSHLKSVKPDVLYGCLPAANICAVLIHPFLRHRVNIVLRLAASHVDLSQYDRVSRVSYWLEARLARFSDLVIVNSRSGKSWATERGFPRTHLEVIPNGIDLEYYQRDTAARQALREQWNVAPTVLLIGLVGRFDPVKDHNTFLEAAHCYAAGNLDVKFVFVGQGDGEYSALMRTKARTLGVSEKLIWSGAIRDMPAVYNAIDVLTCCSRSEGFPNVIGEAMACETPCAATDVGDVRWIIGDTGEIVPVGSPRALADAWGILSRRLKNEGRLAGCKARQRIAENFGHEKMIEDTESILCRLIGSSIPVSEGESV